MSSDLLVLLLLVLVVLLGSALCSGVEAALLTVSPIRVHELASRDRPVAGARRLAQLRKRLGRTLSALVIANNGFNIIIKMQHQSSYWFLVTQTQLGAGARAHEC